MFSECAEAAKLACRFKVREVTDGSSYECSADYFRFMFEPGLEPTNKHREQQIRTCVIDRKITQGTRSDAGKRYHERMCSAIAICGKQCRSFYEYLNDSVRAKLNGQPAPSRLPYLTDLEWLQEKNQSFVGVERASSIFRC